MTAEVIAALFFFRAWRETRERLFLCFGASFTLLGIERVLMLCLNTTSQSAPFVFLVRLLAFSLLIVGIVDRNRRGQSPHFP
jgi:uncharacterized membrane protein